jgi:hypothetical protein
MIKSMNKCLGGEKIMITQMEIISGEILNLIDAKKRPVSINEVKSCLENGKKLTYMSIGWLVQEGRVHLVKKGKDKYLCNC